MIETKCNHGVTFDAAEARKLVDGWQPKDAHECIMGPPGTAAIRKRWPRLCGPCPLGCGYNGTAYASTEHYIMGDW